jgi:hypothetical protein
MDQTKIKNQIKQIDPEMFQDLEFSLRSIRINGEYRGTYGFIEDHATGKILYIQTELSCNPRLTFLYRDAKDLHDYTGGPNWFAKDLNDLCDCIVSHFQMERDRTKNTSREEEDELER